MIKTSKILDPTIHPSTADLHQESGESGLKEAILKDGIREGLSMAPMEGGYLYDNYRGT